MTNDAFNEILRKQWEERRTENINSIKRIAYIPMGVVGGLIILSGIGSYFGSNNSEETRLNNNFDGQITGRNITYVIENDRAVMGITKNDTTYQFVDTNKDNTPDSLKIFNTGKIIEQYNLHSYESYTAMNNKADSVYKKTLEEIKQAKENYVPTGLKGL